MLSKNREVLAAVAIATSALAMAIHQRSSGIAVPSVEVIESHSGVPERQEPPKIDVVFALDTTGSMGGLIEAAKRKIWSIASHLASGDPRPEIRVGLVAYRDRGDAYVVKKTALTRDLDAVFADLSALRAAGGGDGPEHVNAALKSALDEFQWTTSPRSLKMIVLVGDAPAHDDYDDGLTAAGLAQSARDRGMVINTIRCGHDSSTEAQWQSIAQIAGGQYASIAQDGGTQIIATPYDEELAGLDRAMNATVMGYGGSGAKRRSKAKLARRMRLPSDSAAAAAAFTARSGRVQGEDVVQFLDDGNSLDALKEAELPEELTGLSREEQMAKVEGLRKRRKHLKGEMLELAKKRDVYLKKERKARGKKDAFDSQVMDMLGKQAAEIAVTYE